MSDDRPLSTPCACGLGLPHNLSRHYFDPPRRPQHDCGHACCDERADRYHDHFLAADDCPNCEKARGGDDRRLCRVKVPEPHLLGEFPMTCHPCHLEADS